MAYLLQVLTLLFAFAASPAFAGYAQLKPPPGWSQGMGAAVPGTAGTFSFGMAANGANFRGGTVLTNAALNVAGQMVTVPVSMRVAANAASVAATYGFGNPAIIAALVVGSVAYDWYHESGFQFKDGMWKKSDPGICSVGPCYEYGDPHQAIGWGPSPMGACAAAAALNFPGMAPEWQSGAGVPNHSQGTVNCAAIFTGYGYYPLTAAIRSVPPKPESLTPATPSDFQTGLANKPIPDGMPELLPGINWPILIPVFNPDPAISPLPAPSPAAVPRPLFVPTGNPVPTADPNVWNQPGVRAKPAPLPDSPWRVDLQPENKPQADPNPKSPGDLNPSIPNPGTPVLPNPDAGPGLCDQYPGIAACAPAGDGKPTPEEVKDFCVANPTVLACQKLGDLTPEPLQTKTVPLAINQDSGWNLASASCPAPKTVVLSGMSYNFGMGPLCDFASGIRPLVVGFAWITAILGFIGLSRKD